MSYNGIGLSSAKGSSTSGHIQRSLANNNNNNSKNKNYLTRNNNKIKDDKKKRVIKKDLTLLNHKRKRNIELKVLEYKEKLINDKNNEKLTDDQIKDKLSEYRKELIENPHSEDSKTSYKSRKSRESEESTKD